MAVFTLPDGTAINTDYVTIVWPIYQDKLNSNGNYIWFYYITMHNYDERFYQKFDMEQSAKDNRSQLLTLMANK